MGGGWWGWVEVSVDGRWVVWVGRSISGWEVGGVWLKNEGAKTIFQNHRYYMFGCHVHVFVVISGQRQL